MFLLHFLLQITVPLLFLLLLSFVCRFFKATTMLWNFFPTCYLHANNIKVDPTNLDIFKFLLKITKGKYQEA